MPPSSRVAILIGADSICCAIPRSINRNADEAVWAKGTSRLPSIWEAIFETWLVAILIITAVIMTSIRGRLANNGRQQYRKKKKHPIWCEEKWLLDTSASSRWCESGMNLCFFCIHRESVMVCHVNFGYSYSGGYNDRSIIATNGNR